MVKNVQKWSKMVKNEVKIIILIQIRELCLLSKSVLLNRRDASRCRDLGAFLPGLELFLKLQNLLNLTLIRCQFVL